MTWQLVGNVAGKDADAGVIEALKAEVQTLRAELSVIRSTPSLSEIKALMADMVRAEVKAFAPAPEQIETLIGKAFADRPAPRDGQDGVSVTVADVAPLIAVEVQKAVAAIPAPLNGRDGLDGKSVDPADVAFLVATKFAAMPKPLNGADGRDGKSVTLDDVAPIIAASVTKAFEAMPKPKDGLGIKAAVVNNEGRLLLTLSDDEVRDLGSIVGKAGGNGMPGVPGRTGADGTSVTVDDVRPMIHSEITKAVSAIPKPVNGTNGTNGKDGLGFDDLSVDFSEQKGWQLRLHNGSQEKVWPLPIPFDAGVYTHGRRYPKGAGVTAKGAFWIAQMETNARPGDPGSAWRLSVKAGQDGKPGPAGRDGSSL